jgi:1,2-diacylglycerol 3-alpha-glucosyltransferase
MLGKGRRARCRPESKTAKLDGIPRKESLHGRGAGGGVEACISFAARVVCAFGGPAGVGDHHRQAGRHRFGDAQPERFVGAAVHEEIRTCESGGELSPVLFESRETHAQRRLPLQTRALGTIAEQYEHRVPPGAHSREGFEHHVPSLLEGEAADPHQESGARAGVPQPFAAHRFAPGPGTKYLYVDAEGSQDDAGDSCRSQALRLAAPRDEGCIKWSQKRANPEPKGLRCLAGRARAEAPGEQGLHIGAQVVGVPKRGPNPGGLPTAGQHRRRGEVGRVGLEHIRLHLPHPPPNFIETVEQVVGVVVRERRSGKAQDAGAGSGRRDLCAYESIFIARPRRNHRVIVTQLAQKVTSDRQMASNPTTPFRIKLRHVDDLQAVSPAEGLGGKPVTLWPPAVDAAPAAAHGPSVSPFAALAARHGRPLRVAILSDFTRIPYANGAVFQTRFLYQELRRCGHEVTVIGPEDPNTKPGELAPGTVALPSIPLKSYPGVHIPMPLAPWIFDPDRWDFDICFAQTTSLLMKFGTWLRQMKGVPLLCVNTTHLAASYETLLPERLSKNELFQAGLLFAFTRPFERLFSGIYNQSDGLVVLSEGLRTYWRERGVTVPIHVIPRAVQPDIFDQPLQADPYLELIDGHGLPQRGPRLMCAGRLTREKCQDRVIRIFARHVLTQEPEATLTLVGDGPDTDLLQRMARELGVGDRVFFTGEVPWTQMPDFYRYADIFMHASLSETYGNVLGEGLWCGTPTAAFADGMGVSAQIQDGHNGLLFAPGRDAEAQAAADAAFGRAVVALIRDPQMRARLGNAAAKRARERCSPLAVQQGIADAFQGAQDHAVACGLHPAANRPKAVQWMTTLRHARPWSTFNGLIYLTGHLRPSRALKRETIHPGIAG